MELQAIHVISVGAPLLGLIGGAIAWLWRLTTKEATRRQKVEDNFESLRRQVQRIESNSNEIGEVKEMIVSHIAAADERDKGMKSRQDRLENRMDRKFNGGH